jgi:hypothetical protein
MQVFLLTQLNSVQAQEAPTMVQMIEWKYKSASEIRKTYGVTRKYWMEKAPQVTSRFGFTSETGRYYGFTNTVGLPDMGKYIGDRDRISESFKKDHPDVYKNIMDNMEGASTRSYWKIVDGISNTASDYDPNSFDFRKMILFSIPFGSEAQFEKSMKEVLEAEKKLGIELSRIYARSNDGYPSNYYILMYPDTDELSYYQKKSKREAIRNASPDLMVLLEKVKAMMTIVRIDHLNRIKF